MTTTTTPASTADVLRAIADILDANPGLPIPQISYNKTINWYTAQTPTEVAAVMKAFLGRWDKNDPGRSDFDTKLATFTQTWMGWKLVISTYRDTVCTSRIVGTREVTKTIPTATEQVTVTENIIEWDCHPILTATNGNPKAQETP